MYKGKHDGMYVLAFIDLNVCKQVEENMALARNLKSIRKFNCLHLVLRELKLNYFILKFRRNGKTSIAKYFSP